MTDRDAQLVRILTSGPTGPADWPAAAYLIERGLGLGAVQRSHLSGRQGEIYSLVWRRPTAAGLDFAEALARADADQAQAARQEQPQDGRDELIDQVPRKPRWHVGPTGKLGLELLAIVVGAAAVYLIRHHLGIPL